MNSLKFPSNILERLLYALVGFLLGVIITLKLVPHPTFEIPVLKIREHTIRDTIPITKFKTVAVKETVFVRSPFIWRAFEYEDSLLKIGFETDTFRNFFYELKRQEIKLEQLQKQKLGEVFILATFENLNLGLSYKSVAFFTQYNLKNKKFLPGIGFRFQF